MGEFTISRPIAAPADRIWEIGRGTFREEITSFGPGRTLTYRLLSGAPVREYAGAVSVEESGKGGSRVLWTVRFEPRLPGTGWLVAALSKRSLNKVLDLVETRTNPAPLRGAGV